MLVKDVYINAIARVLGAQPCDVEQELKFTLFFYPSAVWEVCNEDERKEIETAAAPDLYRALSAVLSRNGISMTKLEKNLRGAGLIEGLPGK